MSNSAIQITDILLDAQAAAVQYPDTFKVPSIPELGAIKPGDYVKIGAELGATTGVKCERFWVDVITVTQTTIIATVSNNLFYTDKHKLKYGDVVEFDFNCVMTIDPQEEGPSQ